MRRYVPRVLLMIAFASSAISQRAFADANAATAEPERRDVRVSPQALSAALLAETNRVRLAHGCRPLKSMPALDSAADDQATYMALRLSATHDNVFYGESRVAERAARHGYHSNGIAENVASLPVTITAAEKQAAQIASDLMAAWLASPGHRANLLNKAFTHGGFAARVVSGPAGKICYAFGVQVFATPPLGPDLNF